MTDSRPPSDPDLDLKLSAEEARELELALRGEAGDADAVHERAWAKALAHAEAEPEPSAAELATIAANAAADAAFGAALRAADAPQPLAEGRHAALLRRALPAPRRRLWAASGLALAAAVLLALRFGPAAEQPSASAPAELSRTTEPIAAAAAAASTSTRVDRIAQARSGDYRKNRFRGWGAK